MSALRLTPLILAVALFMENMDSTVIATSLAAIAHDIQTEPIALKLALTTYMVALAIFIPISSWMADKFGAKRVFAWAIVVFMLGSVCCAISNSLLTFVLSRFLQGMGGAMMTPVARLVLVRVTPRQQLVDAMAWLSIPGLVGPIVGPPIGGFITTFASWHWIFLINLPVGLIGFIVALRLMPDLRGIRTTRFDTIGFLLFGGSMVLITIALEGLGELHMPHVRVVLLLIGGMVLLAAYWLRALRIESPLFPPSLFTTRTFAVGLLGNLFARLGSGSLPFLTPLLLQVGLGFSPSKAGMTMIPMALAAMVIKSLARPLLDLFGYRKLLVSNTLLLGAMIASLGLVDQDTPYALLLVQLAILGGINSLQFTAMNTLSLIDLRDDNASAGNSLLSVVMQLSIGMGIACAAALLGGFTGDQESVQGDVLAAFHATYFSVGILSMLAAAIFFQLNAEDGRTTPRRVDPETDVSEH